MGTNNIIPLVPDLRTTSSISFNKVDKSKFLLTKETTVTDNRLGKIVSCESEELGTYEITSSDDFDESIRYEDENGNIVKIKFKKVDEESES